MWNERDSEYYRSLLQTIAAVAASVVIAALLLIDMLGMVAQR